MHTSTYVVKDTHNTYMAILHMFVCFCLSAHMWSTTECESLLDRLPAGIVKIDVVWGEIRQIDTNGCRQTMGQRIKMQEGWLKEERNIDRGKEARYKKERK